MLGKLWWKLKGSRFFSVGNLATYAILGAIACWIGSYILKKNEFWHHVLRDLGIAFLVAVLVTLIYELHVRSRDDRESMEGILSVIMSEIVDKDIWTEVKRQVIERSVIRDNVQIKLELTMEAGLGDNQAILNVDFGYDLKGLKSKAPKSITVRHELDDHIRNEDKKIPRFEQVIVGTQIYKGADLNKKLKGGAVVLSVPVGRKDARAIWVETSRKEITYVPGSYNLFMSELTRGIYLEIRKPDDILAEVCVRPHTEGFEPLNGENFEINEILLPGQGIEVRFKRKVLASHSEDATGKA